MIIDLVLNFIALVLGRLIATIYLPYHILLKSKTNLHT